LPIALAYLVIGRLNRHSPKGDRFTDHKMEPPNNEGPSWVEVNLPLNAFSVLLVCLSAAEMYLFVQHIQNHESLQAARQREQELSQRVAFQRQTILSQISCALIIGQVPSAPFSTPYFDYPVCHWKNPRPLLACGVMVTQHAGEHRCCEGNAQIFIRLAVGLIFFTQGILKYTDPHMGVLRFTRIGFPYPTFTAHFVGAFEIVCGLLVLVGFWTRLASVPLLVVILTAIATTKIPELFRLEQGFWYMVSDARTDFAMLMGLLFLLAAGGGRGSVEAWFAKSKGMGRPSARL
jgi:uncharacterized membrane protein YphA (DoxX/SURF4 family)